MGKNRKKPVNKFIIFDLVFYVAIPYILWKFGRDPFGDYIAMLISTVPGFIYTIYRFVKEKQFNIAGLFIILSLLIGTMVNLFSGSAEQMLWNNVFLGLMYAFIHFIAFLMKRPFSLYFAVDFSYLQGYDRKSSTNLFYQKGIFQWFQLIQVLFILRSLVIAGLNTYLLKVYGVDGYDQMLIYRQIVSWTFSALILGMFFYTNIPIQKYFQSVNIANTDKNNELKDQKN